MVQPLTINGTELGAQECKDALFLRYGLDPPYLPKFCDSCNAAFSIFHALECKNDGLVTSYHNKLRDRVVELAGEAFTPSHVHDDPLIFAGRSVQRPKSQPAGTTPSP